MAGEQQPHDIAAEIAAMIEGDPSAQGAAKDLTETSPAEGGDELDQFVAQPTDTPETADRITKMRQTMTRRTTEIANERRKIQEQARVYEQNVRDAEAYRALKEARDPGKAAEAMFGGANPGAAQMPSVEHYKDKFDAPTYDAILGLVNAAWVENAQKHLTPYQRAIHQMVGDRSTSEWDKVVSEYGDDASRWKDEAVKLQQQTGLSLKKALLAVSDGQAALSKLRAVVLDKRKREATPSSVSESSVVPDKIRLTREQRNAAIMKRAAELGNDQFARP